MTIFRWIQAYAPENIRQHLRLCNGAWRMDETYIRVSRWSYLYRAVDSRGQTIDFLLSAKPNASAAKRFFRKAIANCTRSIRVPSRSTRTRPIREP
jgi:transposase, IS6 family